MSEELVSIEINGVPLQARKGAMLIEVTDEAGIDVPRFCYHKKLTVAANCRMCLVEVERAPKPLPACATPVTEGMKVFTRSPKAIAGQKATMEFLLINHPLDCPVCDQGGECELQDVAMGYGEDVSRYSESKRAVRDKDIGPLIATDMTRCIHCTRCVRFGDEIAAVRELGATGRGEFVEIGTYVEKAVTSELSGNVIDLCPVGALTAKPSRMSARAWELLQHAAISPHDGVGSNLFVHTSRGKVVRVVPRENEAVNETWISDRDRFSYQGLYSADRVTSPMVKRDGAWQVVEWQTALDAVADGLGSRPAEDVGALVSPNATTEEMYLLQKLIRGIGSNSIDHRLRQSDFSDEAHAPLFPWLGQSIADLESLDAFLLVGSYVRKDQPMLAHRLRKAVANGAAAMVVNPREFEFLFPLRERVITAPQDMIGALAGIAKAAIDKAGATAPAALEAILDATEPDETARSIASRLADAGQATLLLGPMAMNHPAFSLVRALAALICEQSTARLGYLAEGANASGAWLSGCVPHRVSGGIDDTGPPGRNLRSMIGEGLAACVLMSVEPEYDCDDPAGVLRALEDTDFVVALTSYANERARGYADVILPVAAFAETSGTYINGEGRWQSFRGVGSPPGEARPGWKVLRVLGNTLGLEGFDFQSSAQVLDETRSQFSPDLEFSNLLPSDHTPGRHDFEGKLIRASATPIYASDAVVRRAGALQQTADAMPPTVSLNQGQADKLALADAQWVWVTQGDNREKLRLEIDDAIPDGCAWIPTGMVGTESLGAGFGSLTLERG
ncbi:MAG: NADH-quinone oxidoreductase subunit NuoG [Pseudomonadota bacterium]|nr:NADH-quinone oxidoreductase subunit NuoG [Pseudomonadota bacterium]